MRPMLLFTLRFSLRIVMSLVAQFDLELHQMDVKMTFVNGKLKEKVYIQQPQGFEVRKNIRFKS